MKFDWREDEMEALATDWVRELDSDGEPVDDDTGAQVVMMNFSASAKIQWTFIQFAILKTHTDDQLGAIAAGPFEHLMGKFGDDYIDQIESLAKCDQKFVRMIDWAWQNQISDANWKRIQVLQSSSDE